MRNALYRRARAAARGYTLEQLVLLFFAFSVIGFIWEVGLRFVDCGVFVKRGTLVGPWLPIYGAGGVLAVMLLRRIVHRPLVTFLASSALCGAVEYGTSLYLETVYGLRWWDYSDYALNLGGRVCAAAALLFGLGCLAAIYLVAPALTGRLQRMPRDLRALMCVTLVVVFALDFGWSTVYPNTGAGVSDYPVQTAARSTVIDPLHAASRDWILP